MIGEGIHSSDILIVDKSIQATDTSIVLAVVDGEFTVKRLSYQNNMIKLLPENPNYPTITITDQMEFFVWGVVTTVIHSLTNRKL
jgi:DNA polymerase V